MKRLPKLSLIVSALLLLGGCALQPAYQYNANAGGGYYRGQSPYGNADTVIYSSGYASPWTAGWGPGWGYGPGWWGSGGIGFGATYVYRPHHRHYRRHHRGHWSNNGQGHHRNRHHAAPRHHARPSSTKHHPAPAGRSLDKPKTEIR